MNTHALQTFFVTEFQTAPEKLADLSRVRTTTDITEAGVTIPQGSTGTIVSSHGKLGTYEIEFTSPTQAVVGALRAEIEPV